MTPLHRLLPLPKRRTTHPSSVRAAPRRWIATEDRRELVSLLRNPRRDSSAEWSFTRIYDLLQQARVRPGAALPENTVRLGSSCAVHSEHLGETMRFVLTLPDDADPGQGRVSVLSPVGLAVLGRRQGQVCPALIPGGQGRFRILRVSTPVVRDVSSPFDQRRNQQSLVTATALP